MGYLGSFYHAEVGLFYFAKGVKEKKWMAIKETSVSTTLGWSVGTLHI